MVVEAGAAAGKTVQEGVTRITAEILSQNRAMLALIRTLGPVAVELGGTTTVATIDLASE